VPSSGAQSPRSSLVRAPAKLRALHADPASLYVVAALQHPGVIAQAASWRDAGSPGGQPTRPAASVVAARGPRWLTATTSPVAFPCRHPICALAPWSGLRAHCYAPRRGCQPASRRRTRPRSVRPAPPHPRPADPSIFPCQREEEEDNCSCTRDPTIWIFCGCALCDSLCSLVSVQ
jgi:hypothetical protein